MGKNEICKHLCDKVIGLHEIMQARALIRDNYVVEWYAPATGNEGYCLLIPLAHRIVDNLPGATVFVTVDKQRKYYAAGFKLGNYEDGEIYIHNHVTLILRYRP